jgi:myo-inositol-1(or 4)-monophosphatase
MDYQKFVVEALEEVSGVARRNFGKVSEVVKGEDNNQVLTETDLEIGKVLVDSILKRYPKHNVIDEEAGVVDNGSEFTWVVDPIDGTSNFAAGLPLYGIMVGLLKDDQPIVGGVALPEFGEICYAERREGARCNGKEIRVTSEEKLLNTLVAYAIDGHQEEPDLTRRETGLLAEVVLGIRNLRASGSVYDGMMVAKGKYGGYLNRTCKIWDNVAQQVIIEEAGGRYTDFWGDAQDYSEGLRKPDKNYTWCLAAPALHGQLQRIIHSVKKGR